MYKHIVKYTIIYEQNVLYHTEYVVSLRFDTIKHRYNCRHFQFWIEQAQRIHVSVEGILLSPDLLSSKWND